jgi:hypothetical protein
MSDASYEIDAFHSFQCIPSDACLSRFPPLVARHPVGGTRRASTHRPGDSEGSSDTVFDIVMAVNFDTSLNE